MRKRQWERRNKEKKPCAGSRAGRRRWYIWGSVAVLLAGSFLPGCQLKDAVNTKSRQGEGIAASETAGQNTDKLQVVTTLFPYYDFVREIAGDLVEVSLVVPAGMDTHSFEPTATDLIRFGRSDLILYNGGENEQWVSQVLEAAQNPNLMADAMMDHVDTVLEEHVEGMQEEHGEETHGEDAVQEEAGQTEAAAAEGMDGQAHGETEQEPGEVDEHIWTSPVNAQKIVKQIAGDLAEADPEHKEQYQSNSRAYIKKLQKLDQEFQRLTAQASNHYLAFADRFPLRYFVEEYGLDYTAAFAGCSSDTEPSAETIAYLTDQVRERELPVVLKIELTSDKVARAVAEAAGTKEHPVEVETFYTCHNVTRQQFDEGETYLSLMEKNVTVLKNALGG